MTEQCSTCGDEFIEFTYADGFRPCSMECPRNNYEPRSAIEHSDRLAERLPATRSGDDSHGPVGSERTGRRQSGSSGSDTPATAAHESPRDANPQTLVRSGSRLGDLGPGAVSSPRGGSGDLPLQPGFGS